MRTIIIQTALGVAFFMLGATGFAQDVNFFLSPSEMNIESKEVKMSSDGLFEVQNADKLNSRASDFGGYPVGDAIFYCTAKSVSAPARYLDQKTNKPLYNLFRAEGDLGDFTKNRIVERLSRIHSGPVCQSPNGNHLFITANLDKNKSGENKLRLYRATISDSYGLKDLQALSINNDNYNVGHPAISADGKTLYFASDMPGGLGGVDLYKVALDEDGSIAGKPVNLGSEINTSGNEYFPWIGENGMLFFASDGHGGFGGLDVFVSYPKGQDWFYLTNLGSSVNSSFDDFAFILDKSGKGYYSSNRENGKGEDDIYSLLLKGSLELSFKIDGVVSDSKSNGPIEGVQVLLKDANGNEVSSVLTDKDGKYAFDVEENQEYTVHYQMDDYYDSKVPVNTNGILNGVPVTVDNSIEMDPGLGLYALVTDRATKAKLEGVTIKIADNMTGNEVGTFTTSEEGEIFQSIEGKSIGDRISYSIEVSKKDYISSIQIYNDEIKEKGRINLHEKLDFALVQITKDADLGKLIDLRPIYFDLGKYSIRPDAALELDKIVKIMNENPDLQIELGAHTDSRGSSSSNMRLSDKRAKASAKYIQDRIDNPKRISGKGYGESKLLNRCSDGVSCSDEEHALNRRTEFVIVD